MTTTWHHPFILPYQNLAEPAAVSRDLCVINRGKDDLSSAPKEIKIERKMCD